MTLPILIATGALQDGLSVPAERTVDAVRVQGVTPIGAGIPYGAPLWTQPYDPNDHAPYAMDFSALLDTGEIVADIEAITLSATAAALGITIDTTTGYAASLDGTYLIVQFWPIVGSTFQGSASFDATGIKIPVTIRVRTNGNPAKLWERTGVLTLRQL